LSFFHSENGEAIHFSRFPQGLSCPSHHLASTTLSVGPVPLTLEPPETSVPDYTMTIVYAAIAIIIAVVIAIAILGIMLLKKRA